MLKSLPKLGSLVLLVPWKTVSASVLFSVMVSLTPLICMWALETELYVVAIICEKIKLVCYLNETDQERKRLMAGKIHCQKFQNNCGSF